MRETQYLPPVELRSRIAPTERDPWRGRTAHAMRGPALECLPAELFATQRLGPSEATMARILLWESFRKGGHAMNGHNRQFFRTARIGAAILLGAAMPDPTGIATASSPTVRRTASARSVVTTGARGVIATSGTAAT